MGTRAATGRQTTGVLAPLVSETSLAHGLYGLQRGRPPGRYAPGRGVLILGVLAQTGPAVRRVLFSAPPKKGDAGMRSTATPNAGGLHLWKENRAKGNLAARQRCSPAVLASGARQRRGARCAAPASNTFANAQQITGAQATLTGTNVDATKEGGKPNPAGNVGGRAVWYTRQAPSTGIATVSTTGRATSTRGSASTRGMQWAL
jgi:hypothetical protein